MQDVTFFGGDPVEIFGRTRQYTTPASWAVKQKSVTRDNRPFPEAAAMGFELRVRLTDLKRAFRRLLARLPDEMEAGCDFILFKAGGSSLEIVSGGTSEVLKALILHQGKASVTEPVFRGSEGLTILSQKDRYGCCFAGLAQNRTH